MRLRSTLCSLSVDVDKDGGKLKSNFGMYLSSFGSSTIYLCQLKRYYTLLHMALVAVRLDAKSVALVGGFE